MDLEYNAKLQAIMKRHNTEVWNDDCKNDPEYQKLTFGCSDREVELDSVECDNVITLPFKGIIKKHEGKNRAQRRAELYAPKEGVILNNRGNAGRIVLNRMAYFGMRLTEYRLGISKTGKRA